MLVFLSTDRLQLLLALVCALTGTWWGITAAAAVLLALALRTSVRRSGRSAAGRLPLAAAQHADLFHASGGAGQGRARA